MLEKIKIRVRQADMADIALLIKWMGEEDFQNNVFHSAAGDYGSYEKSAEFMIKTSKGDCPVNKLYIIDTDKPLGMIFMHNIDWKNKNLYFSVVVGEAGSKNKIFGLKIFAEALRLSFETLGMHKVKGLVYSNNTNAIRLIEAFGGEREGVLKEYKKIGSTKYDAILYCFFRAKYSQFTDKLANY